MIISLDLGTDCYPLRDSMKHRLLCQLFLCLMDCLCFCHYSNRNDVVIWKMAEFRVEESWTKFLKFNFVDRHLIPLFENGDTLLF